MVAQFFPFPARLPLHRAETATAHDLQSRIEGLSMSVPTALLAALCLAVPNGAEPPITEGWTAVRLVEALRLRERSLLSHGLDFTLKYVESQTDQWEDWFRASHKARSLIGKLGGFDVPPSDPPEPSLIVRHSRLVVDGMDHRRYESLTPATDGYHVDDIRVFDGDEWRIHSNISHVARIEANPVLSPEGHWVGLDLSWMRQQAAPSTRPLISQVLEDLMREGAAVEILLDPTVAPLNQMFVRIRVPSAIEAARALDVYEQLELWLSLERGLAPLKMVRRNVRKTETGFVFKDDLYHTVAEWSDYVQPIDGLWIARQYHEEVFAPVVTPQLPSSYKVGDEETVRRAIESGTIRKYHISSFDVKVTKLSVLQGPELDGLFDLQFPPGATLVDERENKTYHVGNSGLVPAQLSPVNQEEAIKRGRLRFYLAVANVAALVVLAFLIAYWLRRRKNA